MATFTEQRAVSRITRTSNYYQILQVSPTATTEEITKAYRKSARELHPDRNRSPGATEAFQKLGKAYEVLSDPSKRASYDLVEFLTKARFQWEGAPRRRPNQQNQEQKPKPKKETEKGTYRRGEHKTNYKGYLTAAVAILILIFIFWALSRYEGNTKKYSFHQDSKKLLFRMITNNLGVEYYVNRQIYVQGSSEELEEIVEKEYISNLETSCFEEMQQREDMFTEARIVNDRMLFKKAHYFKMETCDVLLVKKLLRNF